MEVDCDSACSSDYSLIGKVYRSHSLPQDDLCGLAGEAGPSVGWDSGMGSDCFPPDGDNEQLLGEFPSTGSGMLASEPPSCTCDEEPQQQPDNVKVVIARGKAVVVTAVDQKLRELRTLKQHYYPEGGWGWVTLTVGCLVHLIVNGSQTVLAILMISFGTPNTVARRLQPDIFSSTTWLAPMSLSVSLLLSPITVSFCKKKSTRLTGVVGGLVTALGYLFSSFATQFHQLFLSYGLVAGVGVGMARDSAGLMVGQYFKRRREKVEILLVASSGLGVSLMGQLVHTALRRGGWRHGLQAVTLVLAFTFFLGMFHRSASLYHPQRRAIMHLKNQKRKIKIKKEDKSRQQEEKVPFIDFSALRSKTVQIILASTSVASLGLTTPALFLMEQAAREGLPEVAVEQVETHLGLAWATGCLLFGLMVVGKSSECSIGRQYLAQASLLGCGLAIAALPSVQGHHGYLIFTWIYGLFLGGFHYSLKMYVFQKVRARNFAQAWSFVQCSQAVPLGLGVPLTGYINTGSSGRAGHYFSSACVLLGTALLSLIDIHKNKLRRRKRRKRQRSCRKEEEQRQQEKGEQEREEEEEEERQRRNSFLDMDDEDDFLPVVDEPRSFGPLEGGVKKPELTCISEEGIADMELPDNLLDELEILENITSCNKVENYLMLSEYEQNLSKETESPHMGRRSKRWSLARQTPLQEGRLLSGPGGRRSFKTITTINEDSV